ncbi:MAG: hypothetical protein RLY16_2561 [Bacteroidota bacterium]|jgi:UDP-2,4-diacetamido-2,4,6-trideoxy-beta-L-altropyranose hydrolase
MGQSLPRVIFRADGNQQTGYGHFIRTLGIADLIQHDYYCLYATFQPTAYQIAEIEKVCKAYITLTSTDQEALEEEFLQHLRIGDLVVLDDYTASNSFQLRIRERGCKLIYIDDHNNKQYVCDALINNIPGFAEASFHKAPYTRLYLGTDFALLRPAFLNPALRDIPRQARTVFLAFGGGDIHNLSEKIIEFLARIDPTLVLHLLIGDAYPYLDRLQRFQHVNIHKNLSAEAVANLIARSEICIVPASSLLNETACIGSKILIGFFADNQIQPYQYFVENQLAVGLGDYRKLDFSTFKLYFQETLQADYLVTNQRLKYRLQQATNLKKVFSDVQSN